MYAFSLPGEKHMHAVWLLCNLTCILPDYYIVSISFLLGIEKGKICLFSAWSFQEFALEAVGPGFAAGGQFIRSVSLLLFLETVLAS